MALSEYSQRMNRVLDHIDQHLDAPLDLDELARVAHFSPFHFHRVFAAWLGETVGDYLQRRRLAVGAIRLAARPDDSVLSVALSVGFGSGEAFARAFKRQFGCTPTIWRMQTPHRWAQELAAAKIRKAERKLDQEIRNPDQAAQALFVDHHGFEQSIRRQKMPVRLMKFPAARVAYLRRIGPPGPSVGKFLHEVFMPWRFANRLDDRPWYGIPRDDPTMVAPEKFRFDCCVEVPDSFQATGQATVTNLPGGRYAVAPFEGTSAMIVDAWIEMFRDWLPSSGFQCDARPFFDYYSADSRFDPETGIFNCELCLPVCPL